MTIQQAKSNKRFLIVLILCALAVGVIYILPSIYVPLRLGGSYKGIFPFQSADEEHYDVTIKMAMEGFYHNRNNYLHEGRRKPSHSLPPFRAEAILGYIGGNLGFHIGTYIVLLRFFLPMTAFILFYAIFRALGISKPAALFWALLNLLAPYILYGWVEPFSRPFFDFLAGRGIKPLWYEQYSIAALPWARMVNPQFSGLFFLGAMASLIKVVRGGRRWLWLVAAVLLIYVNFKFYFYFWSTLGAFIAVLFLLCLVMRFRKPLAPLSILLFVGVLKALPYIHRFVITGAADRGPNFGYTLSHLPITSPGCWVAIAVIVLGIVFLKKLRDSPADAVLYFAAPVVFLITMNQNVITGKIVQPWHYELFTGAFLLSLSLSLLFNRLNLALRVSEFLKNSAQKKPIFQPLLLLLVLMLFFFSGIILFFYYFKLAPRLTDAMLYIAAGAFEVAIFAVLLQIFVSLLKMPGWDSQRLSALLLACVISLVGMEGITRQAYISALASQRARPVQELASAFEWLNHNTPPGSTVLAAFETAERIPLFTHNTVYLCKNAFHENAGSESQRWNRAINWFILTGHTPTQFRNRLAQWPYGYLFWGVLGLRPRKDLYAFGRQPPVSKDTLQKLLEVYRKKCEIPIESIMREYSLQYIFWGRAERAFFKKDPAILPFVHPVYVNAHTRIYAVKTDQGIENTSLFDN